MKGVTSNLVTYAAAARPARQWAKSAKGRTRARRPDRYHRSMGFLWLWPEL